MRSFSFDEKAVEYSNQIFRFKKNIKELRMLNDPDGSMPGKNVRVEYITKDATTNEEVKDRLNQLRRELESEFDISDNEDIIWEEARDKFISEINGDVSTKTENISATPALITEEMKQLLKKVADAPGGQILITSDLESGTYIQIGSEVVAKEYPDRREYAVWEEALNACLKEKYIERKSEEICVITNAGYKVVE